MYILFHVDCTDMLIIGISLQKQGNAFQDETLAFTTVAMECIYQLMVQIDLSIGKLITFERNSHPNNWHYFTLFMLQLATK